MPLYPMKPGLSDKQKITFLRKRYNDAFDLIENASAWLKKNSELNQQKLQLLKSIRQQRLSGFWTAENAEKEKKCCAKERCKKHSDVKINLSKCHSELKQ